MSESNTNSNIRFHLENLNIFLKLLQETPSRILYLFFVYERLSLTQLSSLLGRSKSAVSKQLEKFITLGIIKITESQVRGSIKAKSYELYPDFLQFIKIKFNPMIKTPLKDRKIVEELQTDCIKNLYGMIERLFTMNREMYEGLHSKISASEQRYEIQTPELNLSIIPVSNEVREHFIQKNNNLLNEIIQMTAEERNNSEIPIEHPHLILSNILSLKKILEFKAVNR
jgi:DNA-binding transcriptional regulator GbsR (MarR family)